MTAEQALQLALEHHRAGQLAEAETLYRQILTQRPDDQDALHLLGMVALQAGRHVEACELIERAVELGPTSADFHFHLGEARLHAGRFGPAEISYRRTIELQPDHAEAHNALGHLLFSRQRVGEALECFGRATGLRGDFAQAHCNLGTALMVLGRYADAVAPLRKAVELDPAHGVAHVNLAMALQTMHRVDEAADVLERAAALMPAAALNGLGLLRMEQGRPKDAVECFRHSLELDPSNADAHSNLLLVLNYAEVVSLEEFAREHWRWGETFETPLIPLRRPHDNDRTPDRPLRIGYVSPDFRMHPVGYFIEPAIIGHHREQFEVLCYSDIGAGGGDELTRQLMQAVGEDHWRITAGVADDGVAELIRRDRIDILIDLAGHTARNRLRVFARKPAPVQATYLGYSSTTGLRAMDYLIGEAHQTPQGMFDPLATETIVRLPRTYICYTAPQDAPQVGPLPAAASGFVTFGSLNRLSKITPRVFDAWAEIVHRAPGSRLLLHADAGRHLEAVRRRWEESGLAPQRLEIIGRIATGEYFTLFNCLDILLDPWPHNGGKTTRDALYMGVPVVTFCGDFPISRAGLTCLAPLGLEELVAYDDRQYVEIAARLSGDLPRVAELRRALRRRMIASPLMDGEGYIADLEDAYRQMWRRWCASG